MQRSFRPIENVLHPIERALHPVNVSLRPTNALPPCHREPLWVLDSFGPTSDIEMARELDATRPSGQSITTHSEHASCLRDKRLHFMQGHERFRAPPMLSSRGEVSTMRTRLC